MNRLICAEILKLVTRRGLMVASALLTVGATLVLFGILAALHWNDPVHHKLIGGLGHFDNGAFSLTQLATIAAVLLGTSAGAGDLAAGFFRNLVVTGRPRRDLFAARIPGGLAVLLPLTAVSYALLAVGCQFVHGTLATPGTALMVESGLWLLLYVTVMYLLALGLSSLLGSRATTLGVLAALQLLVTPLVQGLHNAGVGAETLPGIALWQLAPKELQTGAPPGNVAMSLAAIVVVLVAWTGVAVGLGARRTIVRDA
jgi:hypothetical protein